ncbi:hypothetical protein AVEN_214225-1 [Araneus ventricosus]|uniref:Uncharacterized protein n=1 Tax=Araneus ventricosus TaxID=182803 RepID=A0A4Y2V2P7_ARAVE|nr:hypothetical protein AVEN_214225-1 [Araneus ventricosus]
MVWAGISLGGLADLHVIIGGTQTAVRYRDEILDPYVKPYTSAIGEEFIVMDDIDQPHRLRFFQEYFEDPGLKRMNCTVQSPDLNPIELLGVPRKTGVCLP